MSDLDILAAGFLIGHGTASGNRHLTYFGIFLFSFRFIAEICKHWNKKDTP